MLAARARIRSRNLKIKIGLGAVGLVVALLAWAAIARATAPKSNTRLTHFDAIIVLGSPADADGNPSPHQLSRVTEAVHEYERGVAPRLIVTGGAAYNRFVEAEVMARTAHAQGVPESAIFVEGQAQNTIQNACYSFRIMKNHGWRSAEVVSSPSHLPRAGMIFSRLPVEWRTHAAPMLGPEASTLSELVEVAKTARYLVWSRWLDRCE
jgi:uncharacterized SAM-binding protein YcdF (DUF218 family)